MQRRVVPAVHDVDARPSHDEHVHHAGAALPAGPVERAEAVVVSAVREENSCSKTFTTTARTQNNCRRTGRKCDLRGGTVYQNSVV